MSLIFNPSSGVAYLETEEAVPWASLGGRAYTHFVLLETTASQAASQFIWSTGGYQAANALNMYFASSGALFASAGPTTAELSTGTTTPPFGGLLRLAVLRGLGVQNSNADVDYQAINLGITPGSSSVQISSSGIGKYVTGGPNSFGATKLTLGDRQTTPGARKFFGTMHFAGSVNRALDDNELIAILTGDIPVLDYFKHDLVELWDFQWSDASALTGLISGTTFKMFGGGNLTWDQSAPLPVSRTRGKTILGATNRSVLAPVWAYGESSDGSGIIRCRKPNLILSANAAQIIWSETINCTTSELILSSKDCAIVLNDPPLVFDTDDYPDRYVFDVYQTPPDVDIIACTSASIDIHAKSCAIVDAENIHCSQHPLTLNVYNCDIFETTLDALNCLKAEIDLQTNNCAVLQSEIINCISHNLDLSSSTTEIAEKLVIESTVSNISLIAYDCDIQDSVNITGSVNFGTTNTSRYFLSDAMAGMGLSGDFSIVAVISPDYTVSNRHKYFFSTAASPSDPTGLNLYITSNNGLLSLLAGNEAVVVSSAAVPPGWCLVYARRIAGFVSVGFVDLSNGAHTKSNTSSSSGNFSNDVAVIGGRFDLDATRFYTGGMSWIALLETGLSDGQIESIAAGTIGLLNEFETSVVELWDMTYNRLIQPGVVNGINAQRFGDDWGAGGDNPLPYEIEEAEIISAIPATIALSAEVIEIYETEILSSDTPVLQLISNNCQLIDQGLDVINCDRADINIKSNNSVILYTELIDCSFANIALSANTSEIRETEILSSDTSVLQLISNNCQLIEQGLDVINCSESVTFLNTNKCDIVQEGLDVIYCDKSTLQISGNIFSTAETDVISSQAANLSLLVNKSFVVETQSILCQKYSISLVSNICNVVEAGLDVIYAKRADLRLDPIDCEIIEFGFDNILCSVGNIQLKAQNCDVYDIEVINCASATLEVQSLPCDIVEEGLNVVHCKKADVELISNKCFIAENEIVNCEQSLVTAQTKKCQIIEFIDFRAAKVDLISNNSSVLSNEAINCDAAVININSKRALIVDSNVPPILWTGKIVVNGYVEPIRGIA